MICLYTAGSPTVAESFENSAAVVIPIAMHHLTGGFGMAYTPWELSDLLRKHTTKMKITSYTLSQLPKYHPRNSVAADALTRPRPRSTVSRLLGAFHSI